MAALRIIRDSDINIFRLGGGIQGERDGMDWEWCDWMGRVTRGEEGWEGGEI